ncbi:MAG: 50S ribosomal protein L4 [Candidatus Woesearchaeota archaeon]
MKLKILDTTSSESGSITFPLNEPLREDLIRRSFHSLASRMRQPYGADPRAGLKHATNVSRRRRKYRGSYGKGISRVPRKVLSSSGSQFYWKGAEAPGTVGGRRAHPAKAEKNWKRKINKKENRKAINSAICATLNKELVQQRGHIIPKNYPFVLAEDFEKLSKTKDVRAALEKLGFAEDLKRGEQGRISVLIVSEEEALAKAARNIAGVEVSKAKSLNTHALAPGTHPGRATLFTKKSVEELA